MYIYKLAKGDLKVSFSISTTPRHKGGCYSLPWIASLTFVQYLIKLSVKQGGIKYHFLSLWYESTWDWTLLSWTISKHSTHYANIIIILILTSFSNQLCFTAWVTASLLWSCLSILVDLNSALVWMVLILSLISSFLSLVSRPLGTVPRALATIGIIVTLMFHCSFSSQIRSRYLSFIFAFF